MPRHSQYGTDVGRASLAAGYAIRPVCAGPEGLDGGEELEAVHRSACRPALPPVVPTYPAARPSPFSPPGTVPAPSSPACTHPSNVD